MSQGLVVCPYCGQHHDASEPMCPWTGKPLPSAGTGAKPVAPDKFDPAIFPLIGQTVGGKYLVRGPLGKGGMGTVYEGLNVQMGRPVALKVLHPKQLKREEAVKRFYQEARAAGAIGHPNICEVYDIGTLQNGCPYLVMERLVGVTLADRIAKERMLPIDDVLDALTQVLHGLVAAHAKGIVHRDIKPENVFLSHRPGFAPLAKLLDFGVSKVLPVAQGTRDADLDLTRAGMVMGTPFYMSPEQARGDRDLDARVDIYGCGVLLYEALTGKRPFEAKSYNVLLWQILTKSPKPARELRPDIPEPIVRVIEKAISRDRNDRYENATLFIQALARARNEQAVAPAPKIPMAPPTERMTFDPESLHAEVPISVELPVDIPPVPSRADSEPRSSRRTGFEDVPTEIEMMKDFSLSDEGDAATTLMKDKDLVELAKRTRRTLKSAKGVPSSKERVPEDSGTVVMKREELPVERPVYFSGDETVRMDRPSPPPEKVTQKVPEKVRKP